MANDSSLSTHKAVTPRIQRAESGGCSSCTLEALRGESIKFRDNNVVKSHLKMFFLGGKSKIWCAWEMLRSALPFKLWIMPPNSSRSKVSLKLTANNMFAPYANNFLSNTHTHTHTYRLKRWQVWILDVLQKKESCKVSTAWNWSTNKPTETVNSRC